MGEVITAQIALGDFITITAYKDDNGGDPDRSTWLWTRVEAVNSGAADRVDVIVEIPGKAWNFSLKCPTGTTNWNIPHQYQDAVGVIRLRTVY